MACPEYELKICKSVVTVVFMSNFANKKTYVEMIRLFLDKLKLSLQKRSAVTKNKKTYEAWAAKGYNNSPLVSFVIQSHDKSLQVMHAVRKLRDRRDAEIVVIDDGSSLEHTRRLAEGLTGANEFLVRANDLYENITYDRCLRFVNGRYVALMQDDDDFASLEWTDEALRLFAEHPDMVILGGKDGQTVVFDDKERRAHGGPVYHAGGVAFVPVVNRAPMWIDRQLYDRCLHHIDYSFAPFQYDDFELCLRAWTVGLKVGWYDAGFTSLSVGGMRLWNNAFTQTQWERNSRTLYNLYRDKIEEILAKVK